MQHLDEGTIHAWLDGALQPLEAEQVARHAGECAMCATAVAEARGIIAGSARIVSALDDVPGGVIPGRTKGPASGSSMWHRLRLTPGRAALAATILLAVSTTLTLRSPSSSPQLTSDSILAAPAAKAAEQRPSAPAPLRFEKLDSIKGPVPTAVKAAAAQKANFVVPPPRTQSVGERAVADAATPRDTSTRELAKARVAQEAAAGASAAAPPMALAPAAGRLATSAATALDQRADSVSSFEGCYRLSADSASGSTAMPSGLPATFALTRPSPSTGVMARRAFAATDSIAPIAWRQLSTTQASVTFTGAAGNARPVSLVLTAGSQVGVASSGDRTIKVRVVRASCPR